MQTMTSKRNHKFDGSKNRRGLSKLMVDVSIPQAARVTERVYPDDFKRDFDKLDAIIFHVCMEMNINIDKIKGLSRSQDLVMARGFVFFIARLTTKLSLKKLGREMSAHLPKDHSTVIHCTKKIFDMLHLKDGEIGLLFYRIRQRLDAHNGICFDLNDFQSLPMWYKKLAMDFYKLSSVTPDNLPFVADITVFHKEEEPPISNKEKKEKTENLMIEHNDVSDSELKKIAKEKGVMINRKWDIVNTMWWTVNELGVYETRLGNTNAKCKQSLLNL